MFYSSFEFRNILKNLIAPCGQYMCMQLPDDVVTVAMHVRVGDGYDSMKTRENAYEKFPKEEFFIEAIKKLKHIFKNQYLYIYIFTDAYCPEDIKKRYEIIFASDSMLIFDARNEKQEKPWDSYVLEDFFCMAKFDCLIRPRSSYSAIAQAIGNHKVILYPGGIVQNLD